MRRCARAAGGHRPVAAILMVVTPILACRNGEGEPTVHAPRIEDVEIVGQPADWSELPPLVSEKRRLWCLEAVAQGARLRAVLGPPYVVEDIEIPSGHRRSVDLDPGIVAMSCPLTSMDGTVVRLEKSDHRGRPVLASVAQDGRAVERFLAIGNPLCWLKRRPGVLYTYNGTHLAIVSPNLEAALLPSMPVSVTAVHAATPHGNNASTFSALYQTDTGALVASYDEETRRMLSLRRTESAEFLVWHETRRRLQLQMGGAAPAWAEFETDNRLRRLGSLGDERITHAAFATAGLVLATVTTAGEARIRIVGAAEAAETQIAEPRALPPE